VQEPETDRPRLGRGATRFGAQERHVQRSPLRSRNAWQSRRVDAVEQVTERRERELHLALARTSGEDAHTAFPRRVDAGFPQRRLADTGVAGEDQDSRGSARLEELVERSNLGFTTDDMPRLSRPLLHVASVLRCITQG
jgi:hypothetical protein